MRAAAVVLAAGRGERFGDATKQLASVDGRPLVRHAVDTALDAGLDPVVVVVGHDAEAVTRVLPDSPRIRVVHNERYHEGQAASVRVGFGALGNDVDAAVVLLADQPDVSSEAVRRVLAAVTPGTVAARAQYDDGPGHPVAFAREAFRDLLELTGDQGARAIFDELALVLVPVEGPSPNDIDRPADLSSRTGQ
ncbi:MAG: nucleotidyltransferase family protein [Nitriliruptorales bacterium]|nr:nucleotidyltransferase family protein [Nitriliruptorales bacterium]